MPTGNFATQKFQKLSGQMFGQSRWVLISMFLLAVCAIGIAIFMFFNTGAPTTLTLITGPEGSASRRIAERYKTILATQGVKLNLLPSAGSSENLQALLNRKKSVDVGFVQGGDLKGVQVDSLVSLGSVSYQPLMVFYRGTPKKLLSEFKGKRLDIGAEGSGAHTLALALLKVNGITPDGDTKFIDTADSDSIKALTENRIDALFLMSDSTPTALMRELLRNPEIRLFSFVQADAYTRRINYLNKLDMPRGSLDFGKDIPAENITLIGPTVELIAHDSLHPALSDVLLEAAREVHGNAGLYKKRGEFPAPQEHEFRISPDALRYYSSGKSFLYRNFPFWLASLINRILVVIVPLIVVLIPAFKLIPTLYRWRMQSRIFRWYRSLLDLEHQTFSAASASERKQLLKHLDQIEHNVSKVKIPAAFADMFYSLRGHISFVRNRLLAEETDVVKV